MASSGSIEDLSLSDENVSFEKVSKFGRIIVKAPNAISQLTLAKANQEIEKLPASDFENNGNRIRQVELVASEYSKDSQLPIQVTFDAAGKLSDKETFDKNFEPHTDSINKMCKEALQTMVRKLHWRNCTVEASCSLLRYPFTSEQTLICNMPWHRDKCTLSMTTLLSPYNQHDNVFFGGALSFAKESNDSSIPGSAFGAPVEATIKTFEYKEQGDGFIFDSIYSLHRVEKIHVLNERKLAERPVERLLLVCFTNPSEDDVRHLSVALGEENLA